MKGEQRFPIKPFIRESRKVIGYGLQVWRLVPSRHKVTLGASALLMAIIAGCNTAIPLLLGQMVDGVKTGIDQGSPARTIYQFSLFYLSLIAAAYFIREILNVARRYL